MPCKVWDEITYPFLNFNGLGSNEQQPSFVGQKLQWWVRSEIAVPSEEEKHENNGHIRKL